jgi:hypothetical protein
MVKQVIRIRRMVRQMSKTAPDQQLAQASMPDSAGPRIEPRTAQSMGAGHASGQLTQAAGRIPSSPLGVSPWGQPGDTNANSQYSALNTMPQGVNGSNPYGSFDQAPPPRDQRTIQQFISRRGSQGTRL